MRTSDTILQELLGAKEMLILKQQIEIEHLKNELNKAKEVLKEKKDVPSSS